MFAMSIEDLSNEEISYLYLVNDKNKIHFDGFTLKDKSLKKTNREIFQIPDFFKLGNNYIHKGKEREYEVILDLETGLYHYFKDGKEDLKKLYFNNGEDCTTFYKSDNNQGPVRKFKFKNRFVATIASLQIVLMIFVPSIIDYQLSHSERVKHNAKQATLIYDFSYDSATFYRQGRKDFYESGITTNKIKELIFNSPYLTDYEKNFLWNENLITSLIPCYEKTKDGGILVQISHDNLQIVNFNNEDIEKHPTLAGYHARGENVIHILNKNNIEADIQNRQILAHEYIHLLQTNQNYPFLQEALAEIMSYEYYILPTINQEEGEFVNYAYYDNCRYTKILMEILGPNVIKESVFVEGSDILERELASYLNPIDVRCILEILSTRYDKLTDKHLELLNDLLKKLYFNKYQSNIFDNNMILNIYYGLDYSRIYFNTELLDKYPDRCEQCEIKDLQEAYNDEEIKFFENIELTKDDELPPYNNNHIVKINGNIDFAITNYRTNWDDSTLVFRSTSKTGEISSSEISFREAIKQGFITVIYKKEISLDEYLEKSKTTTLTFFDSDKLGYLSYDSQRAIDTLNLIAISFSNEQIYIPPLVNENFTSNLEMN